MTNLEVTITLNVEVEDEVTVDQAHDNLQNLFDGDTLDTGFDKAGVPFHNASVVSVHKA